jgi:hypothetical protein
MRRSRTAFLLVILCSLLPAFPAAAQVPAQPKIFIEDVKISGAPHLTEAAREQLVSFLKQQKFEGNSDDWDGKLGRQILEELPSSKVQGHAIHAVCTKWDLISRDSSGNMHVSLTVDLTEALTYRLASIRFENASNPTNATLFPSDELRKLIPLQDGEIMNYDRFYDGLDALAKLYRSNGYLDMSPIGESQFHDESQTMSIVMEITEGPQYRVGNIQVVGLDPTLEDKLRSKLRPGDVMNPQILRDFYADNRPVLPASASPQDVKVTRHAQGGTVDLSIDFGAVPTK